MSYEHGTVRRIDRSYVRDIPGEYTSGGYALTIHLASKDDTTGAHSSVGNGYNSKCGFCYLGGNHSEAEHQRQVERG